jgi:mannose-1-phosphate guanylyltransferase
MQALILAGGSGTRFWPLSRKTRPKQLLTLEGERSLLQATVDRLAPLVPPSAVWICTTAELRQQVGEQLPEVPEGQILCEPTGRNTAPAIGWALGLLPPEKRREVVAVLPADHRFEDAADFRAKLETAAELVEAEDRVVTVGIRPRWAEQGYGYLEKGGDLGNGAFTVARFREKPDAETAKAYLESGRHFWNAGIFLFRGDTLLAHLERHRPELARGLGEIAERRDQTANLYPQLESISIDYAVMEHLGPTEIAGVELASGWNDLGSWEALAEVLPKDGDGNRKVGHAVAVDARDNLLFSDGGNIAVLGVEGLVVVHTGDTVLVLPRERSQEVREIVAALREAGKTDLL